MEDTTIIEFFGFKNIIAGNRYCFSCNSRFITIFHHRVDCMWMREVYLIVKYAFSQIHPVYMPPK